MDIITDLEKFIERADEINLEEDRKLAFRIAGELKSTLLENKLQSLSAPQIGYPYRMVCVRFQTKSSTPDVRIYINPIISHSKGFTLVRQKDASLPNREFIHPRSTEINMMYQTLEGGSFISTFTGAVAFYLQQEVDLLDGMTLETIGLEIDKRFDKAKEKEKNKLLEAYMKAIDEYKKQLEADIKDDPNLSAIDHAAKFMSQVDSGEIKIEKNLKVEGPVDDGSSD